MRRHFEFQEGTSSKFWEIELSGTCVTTWWGRIGSAGQSKVKDFGTEAKAKAEYDKLIQEKGGKGYREASSSASSASPSSVAMKYFNIQPKPLPVKIEHVKDDDDEIEEENFYKRRHFEFQEGNSSKFWDIQLEDASLTTWWGRIGTAGQSKTLEFDSDEEALSNYNKLVREKTKKGYEEVGQKGSNDTGDGDSDNTKLKPYARSAWKPVTKNGDGSPTASKFSGIPWLAQAEEWPLCMSCEQPMQLFLQLNLDMVPPQIKGEFGPGLIQLFYCTDDDCIDSEESWSGSGGASMVRRIDPVGTCSSPHQSPVVNALPAKVITGWTLLGTEYPGREERYDYGLCSDDDDDDDDDDADSQLYARDKLYGWPLWIQGVEYGTCPKCSQQMDLVFQIDSEDNLPYMFGDVGNGHISQCKKHKDELHFGWACS